VYFGYAVHKAGLIVSHGGCYGEEDKVIAIGHGDYAGWTLTRFLVQSSRPFTDVKAGDVVDLAWRPTFIPPAPPGTVVDMWDNRTVTVVERTSDEVLLVSQLQSFPPTAKVAYKIKRHIVNGPPSANEIIAAAAGVNADGAVLYRNDEPIVKELYRVKDGWLFDLKTCKPAVGIERGFDETKGLVSRMWARLTGGGK